MAKKKMELEAEAKRLEETERLVEDADVVLDVGEDAAGLTGVVSASDLAIYDDDDFLLDLGLEFGLRIGPRFIVGSSSSSLSRVMELALRVASFGMLVTVRLAFVPVGVDGAVPVLGERVVAVVVVARPVLLLSLCDGIPSIVDDASG
mmetsp:Transcript_43764/g.52493  ORF Transcript_43764/g.52493 Transcript_43764/m.52493 type:complete len:148 (-) Transcript_43764:242-685(-)